MLETIRRHQQSWLTYLIFIAIIVVFAVNFGPGSSSCRGVTGTHIAASVDGDPIRQQDFAMLYQRRLDAMRRQAQQGKFEFTNEMADRMGLRTQVLDQLIAKKLLTHEAARRGLVVPDDELLEYLKTSYGVTDVTPEQYKNWVERTFQSNVQRFELDARDELRAQKMQDVITDNITVSDGELKNDYMREHDRAMVNFMRFDASSVVVPAPTDAAIAGLIANERPALEERYNADALKYRTPEARRARQIVRTLASDASSEEVQAAKRLLLELKIQLDGGADFAALAKQHSQDEATAKSGGDLGLVQRGQLAKILEDALFAQKPNEVSGEPVRTPQGLHLLQVTEIKPPEKRELATVEREVAIAVLRDRATETLAQAEAQAFLAALKSGKSLESLTIDEEAARSAKTDPKKKTDAKKLTRLESPWVLKSEEAIPRIGVSQPLHDEIFALTKENPLSKTVHKVGHTFYVVVLKERETPDLAKFEVEKSTLREQALWGKKSRVFQDWVKHLRGRATIELNEQLVGSPEQAG